MALLRGLSSTRAFRSPWPKSGSRRRSHSRRSWVGFGQMQIQTRAGPSRACPLVTAGALAAGRGFFFPNLSDKLGVGRTDQGRPPPPAPQNAQPLVVKIDNPLCRPKKICGLKNRSMPTTPGVRQPRASEGADDGLDELGAPFCAGRLRKLKEAKASRAKPAACAQAGPTLGSSLLPQKTAPLIGSGSSSKTARPKRGRPASGASSGSAESPHRSMEGPIRRASRFAPWDIGAG